MGGDVEDVGIMDGMRTRFANGAFGRKQRRAQTTTNPFFDPKTTLPNKWIRFTSHCSVDTC